MATYLGIKRRIYKTRLFVVLKPAIEKFTQFECAISSYWVNAAHSRLHSIQWDIAPQPEHYDYSINLHSHWQRSRASWWLERGCFGTLTQANASCVLDLCCGDGFNTRNFYSYRAERVVACDFDERALATARQKNSALNIEYVQSDIRTNMPDGTFQNVFWDGAIEHFTIPEIEKILDNIKNRLTVDGILSGYTIAARDEGPSLSHHEHEFADKEELADVLARQFENVRVFETVYPERHNLYFWASDGALPFDAEWPNSVVKRRTVAIY